MRITSAKIVLIAKQGRKGDWISLSVPRGKSTDFTRRVMNNEASRC